MYEIENAYKALCDFCLLGHWTNEQLVMHGLADINESPAMITDIGMRAVGQVFSSVRTLQIYNCPHLHLPLSWFDGKSPFRFKCSVRPADNPN